MDKPGVTNVLIVGGGTAGWSAAAGLAQLIGKNLNISLVESDQIGTVGVGEATIPTFLLLHRLLQIKEAEFLAATQGTIKLGISFENWKAIGEKYIHAFGFTGQGCWAAGFQHFWLKGRELGISDDYSVYSPELMAARAGRFGFLKQDPLNYAYHLDATRYAQYLRRRAEQAGVKRIEGRIVTVNQDASGDISDVVLESGHKVEADFFIDCSGLAALLIDKTLASPFEDWSHWLPCDRAVAVQTSADAVPIPYTRSIAHPFGWQWRIPLQHRVGNGMVFSSSHVSDDVATETLLSNISGERLIEPRVIRFRTGQRRASWTRNCVAIGLAAGFLEPLESTSIHLIQRGIVRLMQIFPFGGVNEADRTEFNRQMSAEFDFIRDFIIMHYHLNERTDSDFWTQCREMSIPESLQHRLELFRESGRVFQQEGDIFGENSWTQVMMGQGLQPQSYHPIVDMMGDEEFQRFMLHQKQKVEAAVSQLPSHGEFLSRYCPADMDL